MSFTLLVYELIPEETRMYVIPNQHITPEYRRLLEQAHGNIIGATELSEEAKAATDRLAAIVGNWGNEEDYVREGDNFEEAFGISIEEHKRINSMFLPFKIEHTEPITQTPFTNVYWFGFYC